MGVNGEEQTARFSFETFRFIQGMDETISTYYVHCATRLCVSSFCPTLNQVGAPLYKSPKITDTNCFFTEVDPNVQGTIEEVIHWILPVS